jgi:hypothetical protein
MFARTLTYAAIACWTFLVAAAPLGAAEPPALTTLSDASLKYQVPEKPYVVLKRADVEAVVVDNRSVKDEVLAEHQPGYSGIAVLRHRKRPQNLFVPRVAGLNFEHIHDGTTQDRKVLFEPRQAPMELRLIDQFTAELYQKPTPHWRLESCSRYRLLEDGTIEMTFECVPRERTFKNGYIGLFWASYINEPESLDIHFKGVRAGVGAAGPQVAQWMRGITPAHGELSTTIARDDAREFPHDADFPLSLVFSRSRYFYAEPWYYGISHGLAYVQMFRPQDQVRLSQSPSGGSAVPKNPAWDFQFLIPNYEVGKRYQMVMRAAYIPYESPEQVAKATAASRAALGLPTSEPTER